MSLQLPELFKQDIQGKDTQLFPVVIISNYKEQASGDSAFVGDKHFISTNVWTDPTFNNVYKPILLNIPSLKESLDVQSRKYKISSVSLDISNYRGEYNGERFSDSVTSSLINTEVRIFWVSPSVRRVVLYDQDQSEPDAAFQVFYGHIRKYDLDDEKVRLTVEDRSQSYLHKDLPKSSLGAGNDVPDGYKNKPYPMVYGEVDRSPLVIKYDNENYGNNITLYSDSKSRIEGSPNWIDGTEDIGSDSLPQSPLYIHLNNKYYNITQYVSDSADAIDVLSEINNFTFDPYGNTIQFQSVDGNYTQNNILGIWIKRNFNNVEFIKGKGNATYGNGFGTTFAYNGQDNADESTFPLGSSNILDSSTDTFCLIKGLQKSVVYPEYEDGEWSVLKLSLEPFSEFESAVITSIDANGDEIESPSPISTWIYVKVGHSNVGYENTQPEGYYTHWGIWGYSPTSNRVAYPKVNFGYLDYNIDACYPGTCINFHTLTAISTFNYNSIDGNDNSWLYKMVEKINLLNDIYIGIPMHRAAIGAGEEVLIDVGTKFYHSFIVQQAKLNGIQEQEYYGNVTGRMLSEIFPDDYNNNPRAILEDIFRNELNAFVPSTDQPTMAKYKNWKYGFTITERQNSKKIIENICSIAPIITRFDNMGNLKFNDIPKEGGGHYDTAGTYISPDVTTESENHLIKEQDVIDFSFKRTPIDEVYTKIEFQYNWDYAKGEFASKRSVSTDIMLCFDLNQDGVFQEYNYDYYGFPTDVDKLHSTSTLVIDDDRGKYIRDDATAERFVTWMLSWYSQQHIIMKTRLPLKYLNLEIGDLVQYDKLISGVKPYGVDYSDNQSIAFGQENQDVYKTFQIISTSKHLDYVEIEAIQLHRLWSVTGDVDEETGELISLHQGSITGCSETIVGCRNEDACNYDAYANTPCTNCCVYPELLCSDSTGFEGVGDYNTIQSFCPDDEIPENYQYSVAEGQCNDLCDTQVDDCGNCGGDYFYADGQSPPFTNGKCDCAGNEYDCAGICGGNAELDECGVCNGNSVNGCIENDFGILTCGEEVGYNCDCNNNVYDCALECGGSAQFDDCGVCNGSGDSCEVHININDIFYGYPNNNVSEAFATTSIMNNPTMPFQYTAELEQGEISYNNATLSLNGFNLAPYEDIYHGSPNPFGSMQPRCYIENSYIPSNYPNFAIDVSASGNYVSTAGVGWGNKTATINLKVKVYRQVTGTDQFFNAIPSLTFPCKLVVEELMTVQMVGTQLNANALILDNLIKEKLNIFSVIEGGLSGDTSETSTMSNETFAEIKLDIEVNVHSVQIEGYTGDLSNITYSNGPTNPIRKSIIIKHSGLDEQDENCTAPLGNIDGNPNNSLAYDWYYAYIYRSFNTNPNEEQFRCFDDRTQWNTPFTNTNNLDGYCCAVAGLSPPYSVITQNDLMIMEVMYMFGIDFSIDSIPETANIKLIYGNGEAEIDKEDIIACFIKVKNPIEITDKTPLQYTIYAREKGIFISKLREGSSNLNTLFTYIGDLDIDYAIGITMDGGVERIRVNKAMDFAELLETNAEDMTIYSENMKNTGMGIKPVSVMKVVDPIIPDLDSVDGEFYLQDGTPYIGKYHIHQDTTQRMSGANHTEKSENLYFKDEWKGQVLDDLKLANMSNYSNTIKRRINGKGVKRIIRRKLNATNS